MNVQDEFLVRQSKWSSRRVLLLYWFAIVFIGTGTAVGISASILKPTYSITGYDHSGISDPWGPDDCIPCHQAEVDGWNLTKHSFILSEFTNATGTYIMHNASDGTNYIYNKTEFLADGGCCHVTRWENTTVDTVNGPVTGDAWFIGISCAACHPEPGEEAQYFMDPGTGFPFQYTCAGRCHLPGSRGSTWAASAHSQSLDDLLATIGEFDYCIHCMTGSSTYEDVTFRSIDCVTCHDPHNEAGVRNDHELRTSTTNELCGTCHTDTYEFLENSTSPHNTSYIDDCVVCHGYYWKPAGFGMSGPTPPGPAVNHSWAMNLTDACGQCHGDENVTRIEMMEEIQGTIADLLDEFDTLLADVMRISDAAKVHGANETLLAAIADLVDEAEDLADYVRNEPSGGFHNPTLAEDKVKLAIVKLEEAYALAENEIPEPEPTTTTTTTTESAPTPTIGIFTLLSFLSLIVVFRRRKH